MKLMMKKWKRFLTESIQYVGLAVSKDQDKEMLASIAGAADENIRDWGDMLIISFDDPAVADAFMSDPQVSNFSPRNVSQKNLDSVEFATSPENMGVEPGEGDIRHTRASGTKYKTKWGQPADSTPSTDTDIVANWDKKSGYTPFHRRKQTAKEFPRPDFDDAATADTISATPPSMSPKKLKKKKTEPYTRT